MEKKLILASTSSYRKELLKRLNIPFQTRDPGVNEDIIKKSLEEPRKIAEELAKLKAQRALRGLDEVSIGSDQVLDLEGGLGVPMEELEGVLVWQVPRREQSRVRGHGSDDRLPVFEVYRRA